MTKQPKTEIETMDFETAFAELGENLAQLEGEDLPLDKALALYERGQALSKRCSQLLEEAELKIRQLSEETPPEAEG